MRDLRMIEPGLPIAESTNCPRGQGIRIRHALVMHPLDVITLQHGHDFEARLDAVAEYFTERAHAQLDALQRRIELGEYP